MHVILTFTLFTLTMMSSTRPCTGDSIGGGEQGPRVRLRVLPGPDGLRQGHQRDERQIPGLQVRKEETVLGLYLENELPLHCRIGVLCASLVAPRTTICLLSSIRPCYSRYHIPPTAAVYIGQ